MSSVLINMSLSTRLPVQTPILDRLGKVLLADGFASLKIGNGPGHLEDAGEEGRRVRVAGSRVAGSGLQYCNLGLYFRDCKPYRLWSEIRGHAKSGDIVLFR